MQCVCGSNMEVEDVRGNIYLMSCPFCFAIAEFSWKSWEVELKTLEWISLDESNKTPLEHSKLKLIIDTSGREDEEIQEIYILEIQSRIEKLLSSKDVQLFFENITVDYDTRNAKFIMRRRAEFSHKKLHHALSLHLSDTGFDLISLKEI